MRSKDEVTRDEMARMDGADVAPMPAASAFDALPGQALCIGHGWQLE